MPTAYSPGAGKLEIRASRTRAQKTCVESESECPRHRRFRDRSRRPAMRQVDQDLNTLLDNLMALLATNTGDEAHAAGIVLVSPDHKDPAPAASRFLSSKAAKDS